MASDIIPDDHTVVLGSDWHPLENYGGETFRWVTNDAIIYVPVFHPFEIRVSFEIEPGPGLGSQPLKLTVFDRDDREVAKLVIARRGPQSFVLPAVLPTMHWLRFHVDGGGLRTPGLDARILNFRIFRLVVRQGGNDVVSALDGVRVGRGWSFLESPPSGPAFRWVNNDAQVEITSTHASAIELDVEPGPGVTGQPFILKALDSTGSELAAVEVNGRERVSIPLPRPRSSALTVWLRAEGGGQPSPGDSRIMNFRVFQVVTVDAVA